MRVESDVITTDGGSRYHTSAQCWAFRAGRKGSDTLGMTSHQILTMTRREAREAGRTQCEVCKPS
jgi:hypothetical protein